MNYSLATDLYELTMAYGYWKLGMQDRPAAFSLNYRRPPFGGTYAIAAGLGTLIDFIEAFHFSPSDLSYLEGLNLFEPEFLDYLATLKLKIDLDAAPEGTPIFPYEPLLNVKGPLLQAQILESAALNLINFQTLIATKASRIVYAAEGDEVIEFGLRRAQGMDGALSAGRAAFIGGCHSTSNVLVGKEFGIPVRGTHAHSWIMAFDDELTSFEAYAKVMPGNCVFLIDTYHTLEGAKRAIKVALKLKEKGHIPLGVRLDSGDFAKLSIAVRKLLDEAGLFEMKIMASNELDENIIKDLKKQGAKVDLWGVGTHLVTAKDQPALDGVYKLVAIQNKEGEWESKLKLSEQIVKTTNPGILQIRRYQDESGMYVGDMLYNSLQKPPAQPLLIDPIDPTKRKEIKCMRYRDLLVPIFEKGKRTCEMPPLSESRERANSELSRFSPAMRRFLHPEPYFMGLESSLYQLKLDLTKRNIF